MQKKKQQTAKKNGTEKKAEKKTEKKTEKKKAKGLAGSLVLCTFCPTLLAHGPLVTPDLTCAAPPPPPLGPRPGAGTKAPPPRPAAREPVLD